MKYVGIHGAVHVLWYELAITKMCDLDTSQKLGTSLLLSIIGL